MRRIGWYVAVVLLANFAFEGGAGILMFARPAAVFPGAGPQTAAVARTLAMAAVAAGTLGLALFLVDENGRAFRAALWVLAAFHVGLAVVHGANALSHYVVVAAMSGHTFLAALFAVALFVSRPPRAG